MSKKTKIILGVAVAVVLAVVADGLHPEQGQEPAARDDRQGREDRPRLQGHGQRQDPGAPQGGPLGPRHGADRQPGRQGGRQGQEGAAPPPDRPGAARRRGRGQRGELSPRCATTWPPPGRPPSRRASTSSAPSRTTTRRSSPRPSTRRRGRRLDTAQANLAATEQRMRQAGADPGREPRLALEDDRHRADRRRRDRTCRSRRARSRSSGR